MDKPLLDISALSVSYGEAVALSDVNLHMTAGERLILLGRNGAGKSTLLHTIAGLVPPAAGKISFKGVDVGKRPAYEMARCGVALVSEGRRVFPSMSVRDNLLVGGSWIPQGTRGETLEATLSLFPVLRERYAQFAGTLSGGERQMLLIGRALMLKPALLLLDEASQGLAPRIVDEVLDIVERIGEMGVSTLVVEQNTRALRLAGRVLILNRGQLVFEGNSKDESILAKVRDHYLETTGT